MHMGPPERAGRFRIRASIRPALVRDLRDPALQMQDPEGQVFALAFAD